MRSPPGSVSPTATICASREPSASRTATGLGPASMEAAKAMVPPGPTAGQRPKWVIVPPAGAGSPRRETTRGRPPSTAKIAASTGANLSMPWNATTPASLRPTRSENLAKMPPMGVSSPAPASIWMRSPLVTKMPPGTALPSTTAAKATAPLALMAGGPKAAKTPPAGAGSPWATTFRNAPPLLTRMASSDSRPRRMVARKMMSPRALIAGTSRPASTLDGMPGAGLPVVATARRRPADHAKMPSTARPPDAAAQRREERDVAARVDGGDHRERLLAEAIEGAAAGRRIAGARDRAQGGRLGAGRGRRDAGGKEHEDDPADHEPARARAHTGGV